MRALLRGHTSLSDHHLLLHRVEMQPLRLPRLHAQCSGPLQYMFPWQHKSPCLVHCTHWKLMYVSVLAVTVTQLAILACGVFVNWCNRVHFLLVCREQRMCGVSMVGAHWDGKLLNRCPMWIVSLCKLAGVHLPLHLPRVSTQRGARPVCMLYKPRGARPLYALGSDL